MNGPLPAGPLPAGPLPAGILFSLAVSLALTLVIETAFFLLTGKRGRKDLLLLLLVNLLTNPVVVLSFWLLTSFAGFHAYAALVPLELFAVLAEGYYFQRYGRSFRRPYLFALGANMVSFWTGVLIEQFI